MHINANQWKVNGNNYFLNPLKTIYLRLFIFSDFQIIFSVGVQLPS